MAKAGWCATASCVLFAFVALHEWVYKSDHPHAYGPALVIAIAGLAGALLAGAVAWMALLLATR